MTLAEISFPSPGNTEGRAGQQSGSEQSKLLQGEPVLAEMHPGLEEMGQQGQPGQDRTWTGP